MRKDPVSSPGEITFFRHNFDDILTVVDGSGTTISGDLRFAVLH
jgi:hypothetical protein